LDDWISFIFRGSRRVSKAHRGASASLATHCHSGMHNCINKLVRVTRWAYSYTPSVAPDQALMDREDSLLAEFKARHVTQSHQKRTIRPSARYLGVDNIARQVKHLEVSSTI
jgi:hypothetical protein